MTIAEAYNNVAKMIEQNLSLGNFKTFEQVEIAKNSLLILKQALEEKFPSTEKNGLKENQQLTK